MSRSTAIVAMIVVCLAGFAPTAAAKPPAGHGNSKSQGSGGNAQSKGSGGNSSAAHACHHGGYLSLVGADGTTFRNVGACVSFAAHGGKFATGIIIPARKSATLSAASFGDFTTNCPSDPLAYGYQLDFGSNVQVDSRPANSGCAHLLGATIPPARTARLLRVWLDDSHGPNYIFYSDGSHALVSGSNPWTVSIMDSFFGLSGPTNPRPPAAPGNGNFNVTVTLS